MTNKGLLIKKKPKPKQKSNLLEPPAPVITSGRNEFKYDESDEPNKKNEKGPIIGKKPKVEPKETAIIKPKSVVGKNDLVKSIKVSQELHTQLGVLGKIMNENVTYAIISNLVDYYVKGELTDRQRKQFEYMTEFITENNDKKI